MYNILINNLSLLSSSAYPHEYMICVEGWEEKDEKEKSFEGLHTNEPIAHALIRKFANEEQGEKLDMILSLVSDKVREEPIFSEENPNAKLKEMIKNNLSDLKMSDDEVYGLKHYDYYEKAIRNFTIAEYLADSEDEQEKNKTEMKKFEISDVPTVQDIQKAVVELANAISTIYDENDGNCCLYMDYTGGDRTTSTIMIALTKMLEERGINIDHIWAVVNFDQNAKENQIYERKEVNYIFDYISGLYEFTNYGRADKLMDFWEESEIQSGNSLPDTAKNVNNKINALADSIQLCDSKNIVEGIGSLVNAIKEYEKEPETSENNELFQYLIDDIKNNYSQIYETDQRTIPNIIRWCLEKNMIQQAVTIYEALIPEYIVSKRILYHTGNLEIPSYYLENPEYYYITGYIWKGMEVYYEQPWDKNNYDLSCKNKVNDIVEHIYRNGSFFTQTGTNKKDLKALLKNYFIFRKEFRDRINHASVLIINLPNILKYMTLKNESQFKNADGNYISSMSVDILKKLMYDMIEQLEDVVSNM